MPESNRGTAAPSRTGKGRGVLLWVIASLDYWALYTAAFALAGELRWYEAARHSLVNVAPEIVLSPLVLWWTRRLPWGPTSRVRFVSGHLLGAAAFLVLSVGATAALWMVAKSAFGPEAPQSIPFYVVVWESVMSLFVYTIVGSIGYAMAFAKRVREESERAARADALRAEARLAVLRAQFNPHFVLNLLHSLMGLVSRDPTQAAHALEKLGDVLRYVLRVQREETDEVLLRDEWSFVEDYLSLQRLGLGERLRVEMHGEDRALATPVPAFVLQPLVENSVRHAVAARSEGGTIRVRAERTQNTLQLRVEDDGPGSKSTVQPGAGMGLRLIRERLAALYGERGRLVTEAPVGGGFHAEVTIPLPNGERS